MDWDALRDKAIRLSKQGFSVRKIAKQVGVSWALVQRWVREERGYSIQERERDTLLHSRVKHFLGNPQAVLAEAPGFLRSKRFQRDLLRHIMMLTNANPAEGLELTAPVVQLFETQTERGSPQKRVAARCNLVQAMGIAAAAYRAMGKLGKASRILDRAWELAGDCEECEADLERRDSYLLCSKGRFDEALDSANSALGKYKKLGGPGHDLAGDGVADTLIARGVVSYYSGNVHKSLEDIRLVLDLVPKPGSPPDLYGVALYLLAAYLQGVGGRQKLQEAKEAIRRGLHSLESMGYDQSIFTAKSHWVYGMLEAELGNREYAEFHFMSAHDELMSLHLAQEVSVLATDRARFGLPDPRKVQAAVVATMEWSEDHGKRVIPAWFSRRSVVVLRTLFQTAQQKSADFEAAIATARSALDGDRILPCLLSC